MKVIFNIILLFLLLPIFSNAQHFFRIRADVSIKEKMPDGHTSLTLGKVYYDKSSKKLVYDIAFPEKETWVSADTTLYKFINGKFDSRHLVPFKPEFSIFHITMNGNLPNFGLEDSFYKVEKVDKDSDMIITTWAPDDKLKKSFGKVKISQKQKKLYGIVFLNVKNEIIKKQFFRNYVNTNGLNFPGEITELTTMPAGQDIKVTTYKNIIVDDIREDNIYNYPIPK